MIKDTISNIFINTLKNIIKKYHIFQYININKFLFTIEISKYELFGDFNCNIAMILSKITNKNVTYIAILLLNNINDPFKIIKKIQFKQPGFINIKISNIYLSSFIIKALILKHKYGSYKLNKHNILIEFISANPTGPLHIGHARGAFLGDVLANIYSFIGCNVIKEFYINDCGNQINDLGSSIYYHYLSSYNMKINSMHNTYSGDHIINIVKKLKNQYNNMLLHVSKRIWLPICINIGIKENLNNIKKDLKKINIHINNWFSEKTLHVKHHIIKLINLYHKYKLLYFAKQTRNIIKKSRRNTSKSAKYSYKQFGGLFLQTSKFGDSEDRIIIKKNGGSDYLISDLAYHQHKIQRNFDNIVNIFGADHVGHMNKIQSGLQALYINHKKIHFIIVQIVNLMRDKKKIKISKRDNNMYLLSELIKKIGVDAARLIFLMKPANAQFEFNLTLIEQNNNKNPIFYLQYGYARMATLLNKASELNITYHIKELTQNMLNLLTLNIEKKIILKISVFTHCIQDAEHKYEPHKIIYYCQEIISDFNYYYTTYKKFNKIISNNHQLTKARLFLIKAIKQTLDNAFKILGINTHTHM